MNLVYRDELFPREEYRRCFELAAELLSGREACGVAVKLLALAHDYSCEAQLASAIGKCVSVGELPDIDELKERFTVKTGPMPGVDVHRGRLDNYGSLFETGGQR